VAALQRLVTQRRVPNPPHDVEEAASWSGVEDDEVAGAEVDLALNALT
jgi:hypothetical protein